MARILYLGSAAAFECFFGCGANLVHRISAAAKLSALQATEWILDESTASNCILAGDLNWNPKDGELPLPADW